jgi:chorismate dehydratase
MPSSTSHFTTSSDAREPVEMRLGAVSYLNTLPLVSGLDRVPGVRLVPDVPARLADRLVAGETDLSLCSVIDFQLSAVPLELVPVGQIGCEGATRTVTLVSRIPMERLEEVACDVESHTSVALLRVILAERYDVRPRFLPFTEGDATPDAVLLIGDKVSRLAPDPSSHPHRLDLGMEWLELTGLPFVFATWFRLAEPLDADALDRTERLATLVDHARRRNRTLVPTIARREAARHGWTVRDAVDYLGRLLRYEFTDRSLEAIRTFHELAHCHGAIDEIRPLAIASAGRGVVQSA